MADVLRLASLLPELPTERTRLLDDLGRIRRAVGPVTAELSFHEFVAELVAWGRSDEVSYRKVGGLRHLCVRVYRSMPSLRSSTIAALFPSSTCVETRARTCFGVFRRS